jgi:predicted nucleic acid-binding protein
MLIIDTGVIYAAAATDDRNHNKSKSLLRGTEGPIVASELVVTEACHLLCDRIGPKAELALIHSISNGEIVVEAMAQSEWSRIEQLVKRYLDLPLGVVDASLIVLTERHNAPILATFDHRHFSVVRPNHVKYLTLVP